MKTRLPAVLILLLSGFVSQAAAQETKIKWFGHAAFSITTPNGKILLIDPWLTNPSNPDAKDGKDALAAVSKVDYILITDTETTWAMQSQSPERPAPCSLATLNWRAIW